MNRIILIVCFILFFYSFTSFASKLNDYLNGVDSVSDILLNEKFKVEMKSLLTEDYYEFIGNFDVNGPLNHISDGGVFAEGWLKDLYLYNASAFVIKEDGRLYAAWLLPENTKIMYRTNDSNKSYMPVELIKWANRFHDVGFFPKKISGRSQEYYNNIEYLETKGYKIKILPDCAGEVFLCNNRIYEGASKIDGGMIKLPGVAAISRCDDEICPILSYKFKNKNTTYLLNKYGNNLVVMMNGEVVLKEKGVWSK